MADATLSGRKFFELSPGRVLALLLVPAVLLRLWLMPFPGFVGDLYYFRAWSIEGAKFGASALYDRMYCDYPPFYLYVLKLQGLLWLMFAGEAGYGDSRPFAAFLKFPAVLADIVGACLLYSTLRSRQGTKAALLAALLYAFNPAMIFVSAYWGQIESILALAYLLLVRLLLANNFFAVGAVYLLCLATKAQAIVIAPLLIVSAYREKQGLARMTAGGCVAATLCFLPFLLSGRMDIVINNYIRLNDWYPYLSMNAYNIWWLVAGGEGTSVRDNWLIAGLLSPKAVGTFLFCVAQALIAMSQVSRPVTLRSLSLGMLLSVFSFYIFPTQMHERYILPAMIFCALLAAQSRVWLVTNLLVSGMLFLNLAAALFGMYPDQAFSWWPEQAMLLRLTLLSAVLLVGITLAVFAGYLREMQQTLLKSAGIVACLAVLMLVPAGLKSARPRELSSLKTGNWEQGWGSLQLNRSVNGGRIWMHMLPFSRGLGTHANSRITYDLHGQYRKFEAYVGLDDEACCGNSAAAQVRADGQVLWQSEQLVCGETAPTFVSLDITGVTSLDLLALDGGDEIQCDHVDWAHATVSK